MTVVDIIRQAVSRTSMAVLDYLQGLDSTITAVHYDHGHPDAIINRLIGKSNTQAGQYDKYPLIALFEYLPEQFSGKTGYYETTSLEIRICMKGKETDSADQRYTRIIEPYLIPIYDELLRQLARSPYIPVVVPERLRHTKILSPFWGRELLYGNSDANKAADVLECIQIKQLELPVRRGNVCTPVQNSFNKF